MARVSRIAKEQTVVGLDIGTNLIKMVEVRGTRGGLLLTAVGIRPTPPDVISNGIIVDPETLGTAVRTLHSSLGSRTRSVVSSVAGQSSLVVRPIEVPKSTREELAEMMRWEVERHIPFAASEVIMDFQPLVEPEQLPPDAQNMEVLLAVAQEDMINAHVETLGHAGLEPLALDVEPLAAMRSLIDINADQGSYGDSIALVNVGASATDICIIRKGLLALTRLVPWAGDSFTRAIGEALGRDRDESERLKKEHGQILLDGAPGMAGPSPAPSAQPTVEMPRMEAAPPAPAAGPAEEPTGPVFDLTSELADELPPARRGAQAPVFDLSAGEPEPPPGPAAPPPPPPSAAPQPLGDADLAAQLHAAMLPALAELANEIRRSLDYYSSRYPSDRVARVILYGGSARLANLDRYLAQELGLPVHLGDPLRRLSCVGAGYGEAYLEEIGCILPIAVGLAVRDMIG